MANGIEKSTAIFSPEGMMMLMIFGVIDIIDFLIGSFLLMDIIAIVIYFIWTYFRSQAVAASEAMETVKERRAEREEIRAERKTQATQRKAPVPKKGVWLRRVLFVLEWIPIIGMIPGWTLMVYSELKD